MLMIGLIALNGILLLVAVVFLTVAKLSKQPGLELIARGVFVLWFLFSAWLGYRIFAGTGVGY